MTRIPKDRQVGETLATCLYLAHRAWYKGGNIAIVGYSSDYVNNILEQGMAGLIQVGLEHTDSEVLKAIRKGETDLKQLSESLHRLAEANITIDLFIVTAVIILCKL